jgi:proteic killer suppression protein
VVAVPPAIHYAQRVTLNVLAILNFADKQTACRWDGEFVKAFSGFAQQALNRLAHLNAAESLSDLKNIRSNRLEALKGDRKGQFSIRINDQYRICFHWQNENATGVEIVDYH